MTTNATATLAAIAAKAIADGAPVTKVAGNVPPAPKAAKTKAAPKASTKAIDVAAAGTMPKCASAKVPVAKPQPKMLRRIASIAKHPGHALRIKRYHMYKVGMSLAHCKATPGLDHLDVLYYVEHNLMTLREPTKAELAQDLAPWQAPAPAPVAAPAKAKGAKPAKAKATPKAATPAAPAPAPATPATT